jgi:hypothetical protein
MGCHNFHNIVCDTEEEEIQYTLHKQIDIVLLSLICFMILVCVCVVNVMRKDLRCQWTIIGTGTTGGIYAICMCYKDYFHYKCGNLNMVILFTHSWSRALLEKPPIVQLLKNFPSFYGTRRFSTMFIKVLYWSLFGARSIHFIPYHAILSL